MLEEHKCVSPAVALCCVHVHWETLFPCFLGGTKCWTLTKRVDHQVKSPMGIVDVSSTFLVKMKSFLNWGLRICEWWMNQLQIFSFVGFTQFWTCLHKAGKIWESTNLLWKVQKEEKNIGWVASTGGTNFGFQESVQIGQSAKVLVSFMFKKVICIPGTCNMGTVGCTLGTKNLNIVKLIITIMYVNKKNWNLNLAHPKLISWVRPDTWHSMTWKGPCVLLGRMLHPSVGVWCTKSSVRNQHQLEKFESNCGSKSNSWRHVAVFPSGRDVQHRPWGRLSRSCYDHHVTL